MIRLAWIFRPRDRMSFGLVSYRLVDDLAVLEDDHRRHTLHTVADRQVACLVHIYLDHLYVRMLVGDLLEHGAEHLARSAPGCEEVDEDRSLRIEHFIPETICICMYDCHLLCSPCLVIQI